MDLSTLKICFLAGTLGQGGAERQLFYIIRGLRQAGAILRLLSLKRDGFWESRIKELGVPVTCVGQAESKLKRLFHILSELQRHSPQVVQSQHFFPNPYVAAAARMLRLRDIGAMQSNGRSEVQTCGPVGGWLSLHTPRVMTANSKAAIRFAVEQGVRAERLYFLPNVVDTAHLKPRSIRRRDSVRLIAVGSLLQCKRFDRFLAVLSRIRQTVSRPVNGVIVGAGPLKAQLEKQAEDLGLRPGGVEFLGSVSDVAPVYQEADVCVLTSDYEGTPNVLLEAMASGLPVVAHKVGGVPEVVQEAENGFMVEPGNEDGLYGALVRLINDAPLRAKMGSSARTYVEQNHSLGRLPALLTGLYRLALS